MARTEFAPGPHLRTVTVALGDRSYPIMIGRHLSNQIGQIVTAQFPKARIGLVSDTRVWALHGGTVMGALEQAGISASPVLVAPGESSKSYAGFAEVCDALLAARIERGDIVLALGGGVVGDLAGFAASTLRRGVRFVQCPTSLLAQVDSSVGGKTGINSVHGKNLVGAFHQPALVLADTALLDTLPDREFKAGYAEIVKYGLINDAEFFNWCEANARKIFGTGPERDYAITKSCEAKASIVARDEREDGERALLNLGHTFAHGLERIVAYDGARLVHGEAVSIGLALAFRFSQFLDLCSGQDAQRLTRHLEAMGLPTRLQQVPGGAGSADDIVDAMAQDKKVVRGELTFILAHGVGRSFVARNIPVEKIRAFVDAELGSHDAR